jgi:eukaryotic-like serine/threonine-protein kinase
MTIHPDQIARGNVMEPLQPEDPIQIGQYRVVRRLGRGGMGQVFLAQSLGGRPVALKMISPGLAADPSFAGRFAREVEAARRVPAFYTAPVVDADPFGDLPWLATVYVPGPSLQAALSSFGGPLPVAFVRSLGAALAEGLGAIHSAEVVHCDLKPSNVLLASDGPRIIDFGISRAAQAPGDAGSTIMGTPAFMSPEQVSGHHVGPESDVFSLGSVLTYVATGRAPFPASTVVATIQAIASSAPALDRLPGELRSLVERCLDKDPRRRPTTSQIVSELGSAPLVENWLPEPLARNLPDYRLPVVTAPPLRPGANDPVTDSPSWRPEAQPSVPSSTPAGGTVAPDHRVRPPRRRTRAALITGGVTVTIAVTLTIGLHLASGPSVANPSVSRSPQPTSSPSSHASHGSASKTLSQLKRQVITGHWSQQSGPLTLIVTSVERRDATLQLRLKAVNSGSAAIELPLEGNFDATDNTGQTYSADVFSSNWGAEESGTVPPNQFITGTVNLSQAPPARATRLSVSFATVSILAPAGPPSGITISGVPIPR